MVFQPYHDMATVDISISGDIVGKSDAFVIVGKLPNANNANNSIIVGLVIIGNYHCELTCDESVFDQQCKFIMHACSYIAKLAFVIRL